MERLSTGLRNAMLVPGGGSLGDLLANGTIHIYSGTQPTSADGAETGTLLVPITVASGAFTPGETANGLNFGAVLAGVLSKALAEVEVWSGVAIADGTAGWFRFYANDVTTGASTTAIRMDGAINLSGAEINMSNLAIVLGGTTTIDGFNVTLPAA